MKQDFRRKFQKYCSLNMVSIACLFAKKEKLFLKNIFE